MKHDERFVFFGSPEFAAIILRTLFAAGYSPALVICNPDRPVGRKKITTPPPVKQLAAERRLASRILQPEDKNGLVRVFPKENFDFFIVAAYAHIIPEAVLKHAKRGAIGVHPSLLPKYRGASPIQTALLNGETETGVTLFLMDELVDHGPILGQEKTPIGTTETYAELHDRLAKTGGKLLVKILPDFLAGKIRPREQNHETATMTKKFKTEDGYIAPEFLNQAQEEGGEVATAVFNKIRALNPEPGVFTLSLSKGGLQRVKLLEAQLAADGRLKLIKIQHEGGKPQPHLTPSDVVR